MRTLAGLLAWTGVVCFAVVGLVLEAEASPKVKARDMGTAIELANTPFKQCLTQARMLGAGDVTITNDDLSIANRADKVGQNSLAALLSGGQVAPSVPAARNESLNLINSFLTGDSAKPATPSVPQGLKFSLGSGYASNAQYWLQPFNQGQPRKAAALLAYDAPTKKIYQRKYRKDPTKLADETLAKDAGVLGLVERAAVSLSFGDLECAANFLDLGLQRSDRQQGSFWGSDLEGYEHIMALNMKAMAYLLAGDERARNMAQASRELQGLAREQYAEEIEKKNQKAAQSSAENGLPGQQQLLQSFNEAFNLSALRSNPKIANRVATPYVNPLADYLSAVVAETEAFAGTGTMDEWSRASIAWRNAYTLAPNSPFLQNASRQADTWQKTQPPEGLKVVNVLVGVGAAPSTAVASLYVNADGKPFPVMMPVKVPQSDRINGAGQVIVGGQSAAFELVSDVEGMVMRKSEDERGAEMIAALVRGWIAFQAGEAAGANSDNLFGRVVGNALRDSLAEPSTNSWSSLPKSYFAARMLVPVSEVQVEVSIPGAGSQAFQLNSDQATFVYVTAKDNRLWGLAQDTPFAGGNLEFQAR